MSTYDLTQPVKIVNPASNADASYGYYDSLELACLEVPIGLRKGGKTVGIKQDDGTIVEYWWKNDNDLSDEGLVLKQTSSSGGGGYFKEITKDGGFTAEKIEGGADDGKYTFKITGDETLEWTIGDTDYVYNLDSNDEWTFIADALGTGIERRIDAVSYGNDGQIHYWKGTETGHASYPNVPENHILKTFVTLTEDGSIIPSSPDLSGYVLKNHFKWGSSVYSTGSGNDVYLTAGSIVGYHNKFVAVSGLYPDPELRILGCNINSVLSNKPLWDGVTIHIKFGVTPGKSIRLKNDISGANVPTQAKFLFPDGLDYLPDNNEILTFVLRDTGFFGWKLEFSGSNMSSGDYIQEVISVTLSDIGATSLDDEDLLDKLLAYRTSNSLGLDDDKLYYYEILGDNISDIPENNIINKPIKEIIEDEYTILSSDKNYTLHFLSDTDVIITVPNLMGMNKIEGKQLGDGQLIFNGDVGVDIFTSNMLLNKTDSKYSVFGLEKIKNNQWILYGNLELL